MSDDARAAHVVQVLKDAAAAHERMAANAAKVVEAAGAIAAALKQGRAVLTFGNGAGSRHHRRGARRHPLVRRRGILQHLHDVFGAAVCIAHFLPAGVG